MELIKKIIHYTSNIIFVLVIIYAVFWLPSIFGYKPLIVLSKSMEPTYKEKSIIYYKSVNENEIRVGDIITFKGSKNELISHRVMEINNGLITTKGDANSIEDINKVEYKDIYGKNININIVYVGYYIKFINDHLYLVILAYIILIMEILFSNFNMEEKNEK